MAILCPCCGGDPVFEIKDNSDNVVGNIGKCTQVRPDGDCCTKECNTYVTFPPQSSGKDRALLTATGIWIASTVLQTVRSTKHSLYMWEKVNRSIFSFILFSLSYIWYINLKNFYDNT